MSSISTIIEEKKLIKVEGPSYVFNVPISLNYSINLATAVQQLIQTLPMDPAQYPHTFMAWDDCLILISPRFPF
jgi:hypothetical protein